MARRHDLERPATPGMSGDLQYGEVGELEQAQAIAPRAGGKQRQAPAGMQGQAGAAPRVGGAQEAPIEVPNVLDFAKKRLGGTIKGRSGGAVAPMDHTRWQPLIREIVTTPGTSGVLTRSYLNRLSTLAKRPVTSRLAAIDLNALDDVLAEAFNAD